MEIKKNSLMEKIFQFFVRHWILSTLVSTIASLFFITVQILGNKFNWFNEDGVIRTPVMIAFWICFIISLLYTLLKAKQDLVFSKNNISEKAILNEVISCNNAIHTKNYYRLIDNIGKKNNGNPSVIMYDYKQEGGELLEQLNICLAKTLNLQRERIGLSICVRLNNEQEWKTFSRLNTSNNSQINILFNEKQSTAYKLINENIPFIFIFDKTKSYKEHSYVKSSKDGKDVQGSIICINVSLCSGGTKYMDAILSITTYEIKICEEQETADVEHTIKDIIIPGFEKYLDLLLFKYYLNARAK
ncbi:hypothetical protein [[Clostridium] fimetarium]|uniref:Uncharacterized protein n=1 Tax=[Clostridium] fimetarium TaxID=99656 RepID=A0A1I0MYE5_9FIRM|nr:hypothetical protein [[Clostridium] fimetarium]SEV93772.1 hypothetical protein SAMN05421659_102248 [[Clostridium] fimetarium]